MKILALELSSDLRSVAALDSRTGASAQACERGGRSVRALAMVAQVLAEMAWERRAVECVAVGLGPGSYTGIRQAISQAQGWELAAGVRLLGISSAECLAAQCAAAGRQGEAGVAVDAQRGEFYLARYHCAASGYQEVESLRLVGLEALQGLVQSGVPVFGPDIVGALPGAVEMFPSALTVARLAAHRTAFIMGEALQPLYLRPLQFVKAPPSRSY